LARIADADWADSYKAHFKAWHIGRRHWVPEWERRTRLAAPGDEVVWLDPGLAFGTGNHESTWFCCKRLVEYVDDRKRRNLGVKRRHPESTRESDFDGAAVIDVGCGSGILAISAARFGLEPVVGFDNDPSRSGQVARMHAQSGGWEGEVL